MKLLSLVASASLAWGALSVSPAVHAAVGEWRTVETTTRKRDAAVSEEKSIERRRVLIRQKTVERDAPSIDLDRVEAAGAARKIRLEQKTLELIKQLEDLARRPGQRERAGELKMRLAELYFERAQATALRESEGWEKQIRAWESGDRKGARPALKTPQADQYRRQALDVYQELERMSRGGDQGRSQQIRRDEVLFFLATTLSDLDRSKAATPYYEELVGKFPQSQRVFAGRLALADIYFVSGQFAKAIPHYLRTAAGEGAPQGAEQEVSNLKTYGLYKLAWCYQNTGAYPKAVLAFQRTLDASKGSSSEQRITYEKEALSDLARAFALAGQYEEGEKWFDSSGYGSAEVLLNFRRNVAEMARDRGQWGIAIAAIDRIIKDDPRGSGTRDLALERVKILGKQGKVEDYAKGLAQFSREYGQGSDWLDAQELSKDDKKLLVDDAVAEIRREAKSYHHIAQARDKVEHYRRARPFYEAYLSVVPEPNADTPENLHEMRFYFAELLYKLQDYPAAAQAYASVGEGKYQAAADYSRILALRGAAAKDKSHSKELVAATREFIDKHPKDERAGDMLYSTAYESFKTGEYDESMKVLREVLERFPDKEQGVEAAERILFIHEKKSDLKSAVADADAMLANRALLAAGGKDFEARVRDYRSRAVFKQTESLPESSKEELAAKARSYRDLSQSMRGEVREKALNNALVYARKGEDVALVKEVQDQLLREFPASKYAKDLYLTKAESFMKEARWSEALAQYDAYRKLHATDKDDVAESVEWNRIYVQSRLDGFWQPELHPARDVSPGVVSAANAFLERFPKSKNRGEVAAILAFRKGAKLEDLKRLTKQVDAKDRAMLNEAEVVLRVRAGNAKDFPALVKAHPPEKAGTQLLKDALAEAKFRVVEPAFESYSKAKLDYRPARFAGSLKSRISTLEKLDREYMAVVGYGSADPALKSLERLSRLYRTLGRDIEKASTVIPDVPKEALAPYVKPLEEKGIGFLKKCLEKATEFKISGAGVATCRQAATESGIETARFTHEILLEPKWVPQGGSPRPLLRAIAPALAQGRFGEFHLAASLLEKAEPPLNPAERAELQNLSGLAEWQLHENQAALRIFRQASDAQGGSEVAGIRTAAMKNIAALYIQVGDYPPAQDVLASMPSGDADVAWLKGLALRAEGKGKEAAEAYSEGLKAGGSVAALWFNKALAHASAGDFAGAVSSMNRYVELETPGGSHVSRQLLREWKGKAK